MRPRTPLLPRLLVPALLLPAAVAPAAPLRVVDARGRTVTFEALPKRIAVAGRAVSLIANTLYLFPEAPARVVAVPDSTQQASAAFLSLLDPGLAAKALPGGAGAGPEQVAPFRPDAVVLKSSSAESSPASGRKRRRSMSLRSTARRT